MANYSSQTSVASRTNTLSPASAREMLDAVEREIGKVIVGQKRLVDRLLVALLANGHVLLEGVPGLAKTRTLTVLSSAISTEMKRIQFTPDLLPSDLIGTEIYRPQTSEFVTRKGPIFANILLADEINRAPAKVQSALLQAMQERQVTIGEYTFDLPDPFLVLATQNPIEQEGTYPLPEAQLDRFLMKVEVTYPTYEEELEVVKRAAREQSESIQISQIISNADLVSLRNAAAQIFVDDRIDRYIVALTVATRNTEQFGLKGMVDWGASPRASIALKMAARGLALLRGKEFVGPEDIKELAPDVLRHRILPSFEADARSVSVDEIIAILLKSVTIP